ncbi:MAG TPA: tetratricopeptide repeat protein [Longimicrobium sp.]
MKIDRGLLGTLAAAALTAACASAGTTGGGGGGGPRISVPLPEVTCSTGRVGNQASADSAAGVLALISAQADSLQAGQYRVARAQAGRAIAAEPDNAYGYYLAGQAAIGTADYVDADSLLRRSVELCPELAEYDVNRLRRGAGALAFDRATSLLQANDTTGAVAAYETALRLDPNNYPAEFYLGLVAFGRQQTDESVRRWRRVASVIDEMPADSSAEVMGDRMGARANAINALTFAARQYLEREQTEQAVELLTELQRELPNSPDVAYHYALALNTQQRWRELLPAAQRAVELAPLSYGALVLLYNGYAGQSQQAAAAGQNAQASELGRQAAAVRQRHDSLPVQIEQVQVDTEGSSTAVRGVAVGTGRTAPVTLEFTLHGATGPVGTGQTTITPPAQDQQERFELTIPTTGQVQGVTYRVVSGG